MCTSAATFVGGHNDSEGFIFLVFDTSNGAHVSWLNRDHVSAQTLSNLRKGVGDLRVGPIERSDEGAVFVNMISRCSWAQVPEFWRELNRNVRIDNAEELVRTICDLSAMQLVPPERSQ